MVDIGNWLSPVFLGVSTVPDPAARQYISFVANDFATRTMACQRTISLDLEAGVGDYYFREQIGTQEELIALLDFTYGRYPTSTPLEAIRRGCPLYCRGITLLYDPIAYAVRLPSPPAEDFPGGLKLTVAVTPLPDAEEVDDILWTVHQQAIIHGVQEKLYALNNKPWYSLAASRMQGAAYAAKVNAAKLMSIMNRSAAPVRLRRKGAL